MQVHWVAEAVVDAEGKELVREEDLEWRICGILDSVVESWGGTEATVGVSVEDVEEVREF